MPFAPRWKIILSCALPCLALGLLALTSGRKKNAVAVGPGFNGVFPAEAPGGTEAWAAANAFPKLIFADPLWLAEIPGTGDLLVVEKGGKLKRVPNDPAAGHERVETVLDLGDIVQVSEDQGLYQVAFHPDFGKPGAPHAADLFVTYSHRPPVDEAGPDRSLWRLSRFQWRPGERAIDRASETVLIQQYDPDRWHNGGAMAFDGRGFLLFTCGDGGGTDDRFGQSQALDGGFFGGVFRIDVDGDPARSHAIRRQPLEPAGKPASFPPSFSRGYGIPRDNPWLDAGGGRLEETWALGLRSPHSAHFDAETGDLWVGDVGRTDREELNRVNGGVNLQWPCREGTLPGPRQDMTLVGEERPPAYAYDRGTGGCIIGGMRYRGAKWADRLGGQVIFGDNLKGGLHALALDPAGGTPSARQIAAGVGPGIYSGLANLCTDAAGEIYLLKLNGRGRNGGTIHKLVPAAPYPDPPALLSATGLFRDIAALLPSPALVPYEVATPHWADGARMRRWIAVPNDGRRDMPEEKIGYQAQGNWSFPAGTVLVKHLEMPLDEGNPAVVKRLETRITVCTAHGGKYGLTYRWNESGTDATLLAGGGQETYVVRQGDGTDVERVWTFPSRADCMACHTAAGGQALGLRAHQLSHDPLRPGGGGEGSQLARLAAAAMFHPAPSAADLANVLASRPPGDLSAPEEHRVRSYLDANCAHCHQPAGPVPFFDARLTVPLRDQGLLAAAVRGHMPLPGGCYLKPGDTALSAVHARMAGGTALPAMPPIGRSVADKQALALLSGYIAGLDPAETAPRPGDPARCTIAAPETTTGNEFAVTIVFDAPVPWFDASRLQVAGGSVTSVRGGGYYYVARISAAAPRVTVEVPAASDGLGGWLNRASNALVIHAAAPRLVKSPAGPPQETATELR